jgi:hypothetical protein
MEKESVIKGVSCRVKARGMFCLQTQCDAMRCDAMRCGGDRGSLSTMEGDREQSFEKEERMQETVKRDEERTGRDKPVYGHQFIRL